METKAVLPYIRLRNICRLLNVYCEIFGKSSYGGVRLHHMNACRVFHNIHSITFLFDTFNSNLLVSSLLSI